MKLTIRPSLLSSLSLLSASLLVGVGSARAQECTADADCDENFECVLYNEVDVETPPATTMMTPADNTAPAATNCDPDGEGCDDTGVNEGSGASEGSSGAAMTSEDEAPAEDPTSEPPPPDEDRVAVPSDVDGGAAQMDPEGSSMGSCQPTILTCDENADCPEPAVCDGGECVFEIEQCEENAECGAGLVCTVLSKSGCSSTPSVGSTGAGTTMPSGNPVATDPATMAPAMSAPGEGTPATMGGGSSSVGGSGADPMMDEKPLPPESSGETSGDSEDDPDSMSAPAPGGTGTTAPPDDMTMCTVTENRACFPALVECSSDADCSGDWTCEDMSARAPLGWGDVEKACLPPGITAALAGHVRTGGDVIVSTDSSALGGESGEPRGPTDVDGNPVAPGSEMGSGNEVESPVELGTQGGTEGSMGCSTGPGSPRGGSLTWLAALGALVFASRRRRV